MAEIWALILAARALLAHKVELGIRFVKIHCDSRAALGAINNREVKSQLVLDAVHLLKELADGGVHVSLVWIKAHVDHAGNERANALAKLGSTGTTDPDCPVKTPRVVVMGLITDAAIKCWNNEWTNY